jgi:hypothetical protein
MSSSRTTAAQRRRNGPPDLQGQGQGQIQRPPGTSIQSTPAFSQPPQIRPGTSGRLAGQQASVVQQQQQQQQQQNTANANAKPKMSIPQAITLITLRLGRLENQLQNLEIQEQEQGEGVNNQLLEHIIQRIDILEQKTVEIDHMKQQLDMLKPVMANTKTQTVNSSKEIKDLKQNVDKFKNDLTALQNIVSCLQTFITNGDTTIDNEDATLELEVEQNMNEIITSEIIVNDPDNVTNTVVYDEVHQDLNHDLSNISLKEILQNDSI